MSALLRQVIESLDLKPGQTYRMTVNGNDVELRMLKAEATTEMIDETSEFAEMVMLEPRFTMPEPSPTITIKASLGTLPLPDPPVIPDELNENL